MGGERTREREGISTWTIILGPCSELRLAVIGLGMEWRTWCVCVCVCVCVCQFRNTFSSDRLGSVVLMEANKALTMGRHVEVSD